MAEMTRIVKYKDGAGACLVLYHANDCGHNQTITVDGSVTGSDDMERAGVAVGYCDDFDIDLPIVIDANQVTLTVNQPALAFTNRSGYVMVLGTAKVET